MVHSETEVLDALSVEFETKMVVEREKSHEEEEVIDIQTFKPKFVGKGSRKKEEEQKSTSDVKMKDVVGFKQAVTLGYD